MPADSENLVALPHSWKPLGVRIAVYLFGGALIVVFAAMWIALGPEIRGYFTPFQRATTIFLFLLLFACYWGLTRSRITATEMGLVIINGFRTHRYEWAQVVGITLARGAPWAHLDLSDGETHIVIAIQGSDGARAQRAIGEIKALIRAHEASG
ncbi:MAG TPA: PH domain-containing protein [Marmoricola sp.]|nr:PH domain-containing protein [Marmoricola sp.]HNJ78054.1 PH domain-containing protein [Marmoricola sp.]HNN47801.1 PH domain-containing protein [Marmoricola sp.]HNO39079.1 PH domain-containing protein [Marmoricola sp.]